MTKMTFLGVLNTVLVIMALIYWCFSKDLGTFLLMGWSGNRLVNGALKITVCAYRPWIRDARIIPYGDSMTTATGYSFPSGHTMNAASVYGGGVVRNDFPRKLRIALFIVVALVGTSRMFLGVHTPQDVLVGATAGMLVMWLTFKLMQWIKDNPEKDWMLVCVGIGLAIALALYAGLKSYPVDYDSSGQLIVDGAKMANDTFKGVGWCIAFLLGYLLEKRYVNFSTDVDIYQKLFRCVTGLLSYYAISLILVPQITLWIAGPIGVILASFIQMFFIAFLFPWCIKKAEQLPETT